ncbi:MAG: hypothetical protein NVSMB22_18130 [Chloroflexota bacterium]
MDQDYDGLDVFDAEGAKIGHVDRSYVDENGRAGLLEIKMGALLGKHRLIPVEHITPIETGLKFPFLKKIVEQSPNYASSDTIDSDTLDGIHAYYTGKQSSAVPDRETTAGPSDTASVSATNDPYGAAQETTEIDQHAIAAHLDSTGATGAEQGADLGAIRDLGDIIEIPIVEEQLVKRVVVKEVLRIRKSEIAEMQNVEGTVRKESVEVDKSGEPVIRGEEINRSS